MGIPDRPTPYPIHGFVYLRMFYLLLCLSPIYIVQWFCSVCICASVQSKSKEVRRPAGVRVDSQSHRYCRTGELEKVRIFDCFNSSQTFQNHPSHHRRTYCPAYNWLPTTLHRLCYISPCECSRWCLQKTKAGRFGVRMRSLPMCCAILSLLNPSLVVQVRGYSAILRLLYIGK